MRNTIVYLKMSVKSLLRHPDGGTLYSCLRYYHAWRSHLLPGRNSVSDQMPWISFAAIAFLKKIARPDMRVFEYGSGGSTLFWTARVQQVISIEHDKAWFGRMQEEMIRRKIGNLDYILMEPGHAATPAAAPRDPADPTAYSSADQHYAGYTFEKYVKIIDRYPDAHFDVIIVDGRSRPSCIEHAIPKLKQNGYLVIDNTERTYYLSSFPFDKKHWERHTFEGPVPYIYHFSETTILKKID